MAISFFEVLVTSVNFLLRVRACLSLLMFMCFECFLVVFAIRLIRLTLLSLSRGEGSRQ